VQGHARRSDWAWREALLSDKRLVFALYLTTEPIPTDELLDLAHSLGIETLRLQATAYSLHEEYRRRVTPSIDSRDAGGVRSSESLGRYTLWSITSLSDHPRNMGKRPEGGPQSRAHYYQWRGWLGTGLTLGFQ
jgi:hypothetical protein